MSYRVNPNPNLRIVFQIHENKNKIPNHTITMTIPNLVTK